MDRALGEVGDEEYLRNFDELLEKVDVKDIEIIAISAGFGAHDGDLASLGLSSNCYLEMGRRIRALGKPTFGALEGGYVGKNVGNDLDKLIRGIEGR